MPSAFEKLISVIPADASVLDVGAWGLDGENTSSYLEQRFHTVFGINVKPTREGIIVGDYKSFPFDRKYDLLVLDLNIENNLSNWSDEGLETMRRLVAPNGHLITYIMTTTEYGDPETPQIIAEHRDRWWGGWDNIGKKLTELKGWEFIVHQTEERRPYITWILLKRTNGS